jgi:hypothetical protein
MLTETLTLLLNLAISFISQLPTDVASTSMAATSE